MNYNTLQKKLNAYTLALTTMHFDAATIAPKKGSDYRSEAMSILSGEFFALYTSDQTYKVLTEATQSKHPHIAQSAAVLLKDLDKIKHIPLETYIAFEAHKNKAEASWEAARSQQDYALFKDDLQTLIDDHKQRLDYRNQDLSYYNACLDDYEEGLRMDAVEAFFQAIEHTLTPFIDIVIAKQGPKPEFLTQFVSISDQEKISQLLMDHFGYDASFGYLGVAAHPFSSTFSIQDSRITTHYHENDFTQSIFSIIHEIGHSMYNHQVNPTFEGLPLADNMSMSIHESQSRLLENMIGRSEAFWTPLYPKLQAIIPDVLGHVDLKTFILGINYVSYSPIRIEADEITYPLHIAVRYNLEKAIFEEGVSAEGLDQRFAQAMTKLLHTTPKHDAEGILQDIHWSHASFGYFPTYALGSAYAAQFVHQMEQDIDLDTCLRNGDLKTLFNWLKEHIHQYSGSITTQELIKQCTHESFNPQYYIKYIMKKYSQLLGIDFD